MVIHSVSEVPRPRISTSSGVSATSGMVWVISATGMKASVTRGISRVLIASAKAKASPAAMPRNVIGRVWAMASSRLAWALAAEVAKKR